MTLADFLLARIAEDEERARTAVCPCGGPVCNPQRGWFDQGELRARLEGSAWGVDHIAAWSPARVLAECQAKRALVEMHEPEEYGQALVCGYCGGFQPELFPCATARLLALPYAHHPDFREEWWA